MMAGKESRLHHGIVAPLWKWTETLAFTISYFGAKPGDKGARTAETQPGFGKIMRKVPFNSDKTRIIKLELPFDIDS